MDVRLPDGTVVQNVPDGMSKADLATKLKANGMNVPDAWMAPPAPAAPQSQLERSKAALAGSATPMEMSASAGQTDADEANGLAQAPNAARALAGGALDAFDAAEGLPADPARNQRLGLTWPGNPDATKVLGGAGGFLSPMPSAAGGAVAAKVANGIASREEITATRVAWAKAGFSSEQAAAAHELGLRSGVDNPVAGQLAGPSTRRLLINNNADVGNAVARYAARVPEEVSPGVTTPLTKEALDAALKPMQDVYRRAAAGLPNGDQVLQKLSELRHDGFAAVNSDDPAVIAKGRDLLKQADQLENVIAKNISPTSGTSLQQLQAARQAIAQNRTVAESLRGEDIDLAKLGRIYRNSPTGYFQDGPLKTLARFADNNGAVVGARIKGFDTTLRQGTEDAANALQLNKPGTWPSALARLTTAPQRIVKGPGVQQALKTMVPRDPNEFAPLPMTGLQRPPGAVGVGPRQAEMSLPQGTPAPALNVGERPPPELGPPLIPVGQAGVAPLGSEAPTFPSRLGEYSRFLYGK